MQRRRFIQYGAAAGVAGALPAMEAAEGAAVPDLGPARILRSYTPEDHRRRLANVARCERGIRQSMRKHLVTGYIPGQVSYNMGEYPGRTPYDPGEYDERELDRLRDGGIRLIQIMEDWNDLLRLFGGNKFTAVNPAGLRRFINMVHQRGMKILLYASTGYFQRGDPDFREEWARPRSVRTIHWDLARCSPASPSWRAYLLPRTLGILEEYGVDGLFNDWGYIQLYNHRYPPTKDEVTAFEEAADHDAALEDLVALVYSEVKRRGGIYKMHADSNNRPRTRMKLYDYLWVGEGVDRSDKVREQSKDHPPYIVPCFDLSHSKLENEDEMYLHTIPYMQFPLLLAGRPFTGERGLIPGIRYLPEEKDLYLRHCRKIWKYYQEHPDGPFAYGPWDSFPPRPNVHETHARWLKKYLPLVEEGTLAYLEVTDSDLFSQPLPARVTASVFANLETYLVLANYGQTPAPVVTARTYAQAGEAPGTRRTLAPRSLVILKKAG
ncbi:MAG: hypothetical protein KIT09_07640 [Bryobacteraceae bacterium]|nr:hypothetical protein [Bryobacteraceae bacterium]